MKQIWSKSLACLLCLALLVGMLPVAALAEDNPPANGEVSLLADAASVKYLDEKGQEQTCDSATVVTENVTSWGGSDGREYWYVVNRDVAISGRIEVTGNVHLILADECSLTASQGINVAEGNSLTIYAQSVGEGMGALTANGASQSAGIGGGENQPGGTITINGGRIYAYGGSDNNNGAGAGIGGGYSLYVPESGSITINGGYVTARGASAGWGGGAGIGGGGCSGSINNVTITGGVIVAEGGLNGAAGIGGGGHDGELQNISITGGWIQATGHRKQGQDEDESKGDANAIGDGAGESGGAADPSNFHDTVIIDGHTKTGTVYGNASLEGNAELPMGSTLTIENGETLTISQGVTLTNNGTITVESSGTLVNQGTIVNNGTIQLNGGSTVQTGENGPEITIGKDTTGATVGNDGGVTLPNGGSATIGSGENTTTITTPGGGTVTPDGKGNVTIPGGSTVQTGENGPKITSGNDGATVGTDGGVTLPENGNVTIGSGDDTTTITTPQGGKIKPNGDGSVTIPGGSTVQTGDGTSITFPPEGGTLDPDGTVVYTVTVTFNSQGGSEVASKDINVNNPVEEPAAPTRSGYSFRGWYTAASGGEWWDFTKPVAADMTLYAQWSWINVGGPTYPPTMDEPENGAVTTSPSRPEKGDAVTITPKPDEGFEVDEILVKDENGKEIKVTQNPDGTYTFTQPDGKVTITVTFRCDGGELCPGHHLTDVSKDAWYHAAVDYVVKQGIMEGMSATTFSPNTEVTRAQAVQILYNLEGQPDISDENLGYPYEDVNAEEWYGNAVYWARLTGVATGYGDGTFQPGDSITRQEFAQMLYNYAKYKGYDLTAEGDLSTFPDAGSIADWAEAAMSWANGNELINGHDNGTIDAGGTAIRAQAASILMRFDQNLVEN